MAVCPVSGFANTYPSMNSQSELLMRSASTCFADRWLDTARQVRMVRSASGVISSRISISRGERGRNSSSGAISAS